MTGPGVPLPALTEDDAALIADAYIEALLASGEAGAASGWGAVGSVSGRDAPPGPSPDGAVHPDLARAAEALASGLVRFHPSFRFEERLAARLRRVARGEEGAATPADWTATPADRTATPADRTATPAAPAYGWLAIPDLGQALPEIGREVGRAVERAERVPMPVLVGGAIASGVSLAGAAIVAWRLTHRPLLQRLP